MLQGTEFQPDQGREELRARLLERLEKLRQNRLRYDADLPLFADDCLKIRPVEGAQCPLRLNKVQLHVHRMLEDQKRQTGKVRAIIVKARKPGISTYIAARFYHRVSRGNGLRAFIMAHEQTASDILFEMVGRFHGNNPHAPHTGASSTKRLFFDQIDSSFGVGTAGTKDIGRGDTFQFLHCSEVAYWPHADVHMAGAVQAVPSVPGTELIFESTANGIGGLFYNLAMAAARKTGDYMLVFVPWFDHDDYREVPPDGWAPSGEMADYAATHGLALDQTYWAEKKNTEFATAAGESPDKIVWKFRQEYPSTLEEAFRASRQGAFIGGDLVIRARKADVGAQDHAPRILGCDFATGGDGEGGDANLFIDRQGRRAGGLVYDRFVDKNTVSVANKLAAVLGKDHFDRVFLDTGGGGAQVYDILKDRNYERLTLVNFGGKPFDDRKYANRRAEMWGNMRDWLADEGGAQIPDDDALDGEITGPNGKENFAHRVILEPKKEVRKRLGRSPDGGDALSLTFAEHVRRVDGSKGKPKRRGRGRLGSWMRS